MKVFKNYLKVFVFYIGAFVLANLALALVSVIFKATLETVQGSTLTSRITEIVVFYLVFALVSFLVFRYHRGRLDISLHQEIIVVTLLVLIAHALIVFLASWNIIWSISSGTQQLASFMHSGMTPVASMSDIPRMYYFIALLIKDLLFGVFALLGNHRKQA